MAFSLNCNNKGCGKFMEPYLDPSNNIVYCSECNKEVANITSFAKSQMKSNKQFKKKGSSSFSVKCEKCGRDDRPKLINNDIQCNSCGGPLIGISGPFRTMLKEKLKNVDKDI